MSILDDAAALDLSRSFVVDVRVLDARPLLGSVGIVCPCGKALATIEAVATSCSCGRVWMISAMLLSGPTQQDFVHGSHIPDLHPRVR